MINSRWLLVIGLLLGGVASSASAFVDPPVLVPTHPVAGQVVSINTRAGICDAYVEKLGYPQISRDGRQINVVLASIHATTAEFCLYPIGITTTQVGALSPGTYTITINRVYDDYNGIVVEAVGTLSFTVTASPPARVPSLGGFGILLLAVGMLVCVALTLRWRPHASWFAALLVLAPLATHAQQAEIEAIGLLLDTTADTPTPEAIVGYYAATPRSGKPPLASLAAVNPAAVAYLLPMRADGDFQTFLAAHPNSTRAKLERYLVALYPPGSNLQSVLATLKADPKIVVAHEILPSRFSSVQLLGFGLGGTGTGQPGQYGRTDLNIEAAWRLAGGHALVGVIDTGLAVDHPGLRQFAASGTYLGGNFIPVASLDLGGWPNAVDNNVDEAEPIPLLPDSVCNPQGLPAVPPTYVGHGTHTSGLLAANANAGLGVAGTCQRCGVAAWKILQYFCDTGTGYFLPDLVDSAVHASITYLADTGAQVINMSFGGPRDDDYCANDPDIAYCLALTHARNRDVVLVAASGNDRRALNFPAKDPRVVAAGGFNSALQLWDESPGSNTNCPLSGGYECGSNYTTVTGGPKQGLMASASAVLSTIYPGYDWNPYLQCGDSFGTPMGDGIGLCTGTSMSAPQISGVMGIMRSINPLVPVGRATYNPFLDVMGVRYVVASTTFESQASQGWSPTFGYGHPDAAAAARFMLGKVAGAVVRNRATPLFRLVSTVTGDHAAVTSPQYALALMINQNNNYTPTGAVVPDYAFPAEHGVSLPTPRANVYVLATEVKPRNEWSALLPLHLLTKSTTTGFDYMLVTSDAHVEQAHAEGYDLRNIQGYVYQPCTPEPGCMPPGTEQLYRACKAADNDCAIFLESERASFEAAGFAAAWPVGSDKRIGYAYPASDSDSDGLPDGFEQVIGTLVNLADSDGDGASDGEEFPMSGVATGDPCAGGVHGATLCPADHIFKHGFDSP